MYILLGGIFKETSSELHLQKSQTGKKITESLIRSAKCFFFPSFLG